MFGVISNLLFGNKCVCDVNQAQELRGTPQLPMMGGSVEKQKDCEQVRAKGSQSFQPTSL